MLYLQQANGSSHCGSLEGVVEQLTRFRGEVRAFALAANESPTKPGLHPERLPLLKACDALRNDLAPLGVILKVPRAPSPRVRPRSSTLFVPFPVSFLQDRGATSTWEITAPTTEPKSSGWRPRDWMPSGCAWTVNIPDLLPLNCKLCLSESVLLF